MEINYGQGPSRKNRIRYSSGTRRQCEDSQYGALAMPICQISAFEFKNCEQGGRRFAGLIRLSDVEDIIADLDQALAQI